MGEWIKLFYWHQHSGSMHSYSEIRSNVWKEHMHTDYTHFLLQILGLFISYLYIYILGKWLQKEDIAETAVHFVLKWGFVVNPVGNNSRMLETKDFRDIASAYMPLKWVLQGHPKKRTFTFSLWSIRKLWHHVELLTVVILVQKSKVIGQVEEELWFFYHF